VIIGRREGETPGRKLSLDGSTEDMRALLLGEELADSNMVEGARKNCEDEEEKRIKRGEDIDDPIR